MLFRSWTTGADSVDAQRFAELCGALKVDSARLADPEAKQILRRNTDQAAAAGVFGVPSFEADGEIFWGVDSIDFLKAFLADASVVQNARTRRLDSLPVGASRRG